MNAIWGFIFNWLWPIVAMFAAARLAVAFADGTYIPHDINYETNKNNANRQGNESAFKATMCVLMLWYPIKIVAAFHSN